MKKDSTTGIGKTSHSTDRKLTIGLDFGRSLELVLRVGRDRRSATGGEGGYDSESHARSIRGHAAQSDRFGFRTGCLLTPTETRRQVLPQRCCTRRAC